MATQRPKTPGRLRRGLERLFETLSARPLSVIVFAASAALLVYLQSGSLGRFQARAVAQARVVEHPARVTSFVEKLFVQRGERVEVGAPLAEISSYFLERELNRIDSEIERLLREAQLARARLMVEEQRWLDPELRVRPSQPSLAQPTEGLYAAQLELLRTRRSLVLEDQQHLTVYSQADGLVAEVVAEGSPVAIGTSVASVAPAHAEEIVAYVPPDTEPGLISPGTSVVLARPSTLSCTALGRVLRRGAGVIRAPEQASGFLSAPLFGLPVYISVPDGCELGVGQVLAVEFAKASR